MWLPPSSFYCQPFINPEVSINSGQMFLWEQVGNSWYGIYGDRIIKFSTSSTNKSLCVDNNKNNEIQFYSYPEVDGWEKKVFRLDDDIKKILRSEEHTSELQSLAYLVCRLLLEKKKK